MGVRCFSLNKSEIVVIDDEDKNLGKKLILEKREITYNACTFGEKRFMKISSLVMKSICCVYVF